MYLPLLSWPHLTQKFASDVTSVPQFERNIAINNYEVRKETDHISCFFSRTVSVQGLYPLLFCRELLVLPRAIWFYRELFGFAAISFCRYAAISFCRELFCFAVKLFGFAVRYLVLPWAFTVLLRAILFCREPFRFCRELFGVAVNNLKLWWWVWATV